MTNRQNTTNPRVAAATTALCEAIGERFTTGCPIAIFHEDMAKALDAAGMGELPKSDSDTTVAKPERQSCGKFFFDCPAPCETTRDGVRCETCGVTVTAQYFEQAYEERNLDV